MSKMSTALKNTIVTAAKSMDAENEMLNTGICDAYDTLCGTANNLAEAQSIIAQAKAQLEPFK